MPGMWGLCEGLGGGSPSSPQPSGVAREADARAAARNTITLPRPGMGLRIWRKAERGGKGCYSLRRGSWRDPHPRASLQDCTLHISLLSHPILPGTAWGLSCPVMYHWNPSGDSWQGLCHCHSQRLAAEASPCLEGGHKGQTLTRSLRLHGGIKGFLPLQSYAGSPGCFPASGWSRDLRWCSWSGKGPRRNSGLFLCGRRQQLDLHRLTQPEQQVCESSDCTESGAGWRSHITAHPRTRCRLVCAGLCPSGPFGISGPTDNGPEIPSSHSETTSEGDAEEGM